jgi:hypothetical protein
MRRRERERERESWCSRARKVPSREFPGDSRRGARCSSSPADGVGMGGGRMRRRGRVRGCRRRIRARHNADVADFSIMRPGNWVNAARCLQPLPISTVAHFGPVFSKGASALDFEPLDSAAPSP